MSYPLPIEDVVPAVKRALEEAGVGVLVAPPGSGKTTIVPLRLLDAPWREGRKIVVLEPRRLATRASARWMAHLLGEEAGGTVGYVTRTDRRVSRSTQIEVVTEGVLTRRLQRDAELADTACVVFDEFHERNLQTDLGLALTLDVRSTIRPDLRMLVMSATIDAAKVAVLIGDGEPAPVIEGEARVYPVDIRWAPPRRTTRIDAHAAATIRQVLDAETGDVLVFLPGMGEMRRVERTLSEARVSADVYLLHGSLPVPEQDAAIEPSPSGRRKIVLSTDIAETSLTVEGIRVVIDSGLARKPRFDARTGMTRLRTVPISRASADQRAGRAGRIEPGTAYRLWSKLEHGGRPRHIAPEISEVDLAGLVLELAAWGARDDRPLGFLDPPPQRALEEARRLLVTLGALDEAGQMTMAGGMMATLPLHPRLASMVVGAGTDATLACIVAVLVDERDVLRGPPNDVPVDLGMRVGLVADRGAPHHLAHGAGIARVRDAAHDVARRAGVAWGDVDPARTGRVLALAYPDRLALRRGSPGRFQLRTGSTAWMRDTDTLAAEQFLVVADLDGKRKDARIRLAAAIDAEDVAAAFHHEVDEHTTLVWEGEKLVRRTEQKLGGLVLRSHDQRPQPGEATAAALAQRVADRDLADLAWTNAAAALTTRVAFLHRKRGEPWPDWSPSGLAGSVHDWLAGPLTLATGIDDLQAIDLRPLLLAQLGHDLISELDRAAPTHVQVPSGRRVAIDYTADVPVLAVRVQEMFGATRTPTVAGQPVRLELLSPAHRPVQVTQDLAGFWEGSWHEVRKQMAGRYPKHDWPEDPASARPSRR